MTPTATVVICGALSACGFTVAASLPQSSDGIPWDKLAGGSAALLLAFALVKVLTFVADERKAATAERESAAKEARLEREAMAKAQKELVDAIQAASERREERLLRALQEAAPNNTPRGGGTV